MLKRAGLALVSGLLLSLAFEPVAFAYLIPVALAGFALSTYDLPVRRAWIPGLVFGVAFYFPHIYWMSDSIGPPAWLALAGLEALFYGLLGAAAGPMGRFRWWPVWLAAAWVTMELWRTGWPYSGMPWGRLSFGVVDTPVADALTYVGMSGLSFLLALSGFLLAWAVMERERRSRLIAVGVLAGVCAAMAIPSLASYRLDERDTATVAVVQGNVPPPENDILADFRQVTENHVQATVDLAAEVARGSVPRPDFVVWPENSTAVDPFRDGSTNTAIRRAAAAIGVPILVGAIVDAGEDHVLNQGIVWDPVTGAGERYTKHHPVAFGEYMPLRPVLRSWGIEDKGQLGRISRDMLSGTSDEPLPHRGDRGVRCDLLRRRLRRRRLRPDRERRRAARRADQQRQLHLHRPDRPAVRDHPAARDRVRQVPRGRLHQRHHRRHRSRRQRGRCGGPSHPGRAAREGRTAPRRHPGSAARWRGSPYCSRC